MTNINYYFIIIGYNSFLKEKLERDKLNILIVEDEFIAYEFLKDILNNMNYLNIFHAINAKQALEIIKIHTIDLCFMDININGNMDGINCARLLNNHYFIPIIYTSAHGDKNTIIEAQETNIYGFLIKPFNINEVDATLSVAKKMLTLVNKNQNNLLNNTNGIIDLKNGYMYDLNKKTFYVNNEILKLTNKELQLIDFMCKSLNQNVSYDNLKEFVWENKQVNLSTIRDTVFRIKNKLPNLQLQNISNFGYILTK